MQNTQANIQPETKATITRFATSLLNLNIKNKNGNNKNVSFTSMALKASFGL